jgi:hypothetical protein
MICGKVVQSNTCHFIIAITFRIDNFGSINWMVIVKYSIHAIL